ncbi:hypothetical protein JZ751_025490 [Albula glossodonta]|uniref:Uncharacterized protein n=1 Tax=Albula glossodonta TaxID=121402 RepID=A0A8T2NLZ8_9TELE|nr:hypothetical protein JZ751_025490 [Albula glossodonta]
METVQAGKGGGGCGGERLCPPTASGLLPSVLPQRLKVISAQRTSQTLHTLPPLAERTLQLNVIFKQCSNVSDHFGDESRGEAFSTNRRWEETQLSGMEKRRERQLCRMQELKCEDPCAQRASDGALPHPVQTPMRGPASLRLGVLRSRCVTAASAEEH